MTITSTRNRTFAVGDTLQQLPIARITRTTLALFAGGSGDHNEIHLDIDVARGAGMDDVFAQGMLGMAHLSRLVTNHFPQSHLQSFKTRFAAITPINAEPTCFGEVTAIDGDLLTLDLRVELADGTITLAGQASLRVGTGI